jgi:hypothetical protein
MSVFKPCIDRSRKGFLCSELYPRIYLGVRDFRAKKTMFSIEPNQTKDGKKR